MTAKEVRQHFLDFFASKGHKIVPSAPIVNKNDPTLMFTNAGMNQFKDYFLGNATPPSTRITDTQKCLRVSGKHNDLEEVGIDSYHHTMFEMLGNWSFGDYFKREAIDYAWELLTEVYKLDKSRLYASVFEGEKSEGLEPDNEAFGFWKDYLPEERILFFDKKDNFWEMGATGPCGPCSEIHVDLRPDSERKKIDGASLVNQDDPLVIEIWNLVFIQFDRKEDGSLVKLPATHVDTGMGFERLCMALQSKTSNYETDIFRPFIKILEDKTNITYNNNYDLSAKTDIAMRVIVDHIRAVAFTIADGELPNNTGAGYVIRRILRRAVRYYYSFLGLKKPLLHELIAPLADAFAHVFPELKKQEDFVSKVIFEEEKSFLNTLESGIKKFDSLEITDNTISGADAFLLYDTYGFPIDLTRLMASEKDLNVDEKGFEKALQAQKQRGRKDAQKQVGDWNTLKDAQNVTFVGYDQTEVHKTAVLKYRTVKLKNKSQFQIVLETTPFYAESGGQVGDTGNIYFPNETIKVINTVRENDLIINIVDKLPSSWSGEVNVSVDTARRNLIIKNHSATHLLQAALKQVLGEHVNQKGSLNNDKYLRFDFSHFSKMEADQIREVEKIVNQKIIQNIPKKEQRNIPIEEAKKAGAMMLFGEKYGEEVRIITFDDNYSIELCGGCHVENTGEIGLFKITSEGSVAAGVRRIEAVTADKALEFVHNQEDEVEGIKNALKSPKNIVAQVKDMVAENSKLKKEIEQLQQEKAIQLAKSLRNAFQPINDYNFLATKIEIADSNTLKTIAHDLVKSVDNAAIVIAADIAGKPQIAVIFNQDLAKLKDWHAGKLVKEFAQFIKGGGGGQPFFATAGGKDISGLDNIVEAAKEYFK